MKLPVYLDYSATTPCDPRVVDKMVPYLYEKFGNPASHSHSYGWEAEKAVEEARGHVAALIGADPREIVWTSGATESDNLAIKGAAHFYKDKGRHLITVKTEHKAVLDSMRHLEGEGYEVTYLDVKEDGLIDMDAFRAAIRPDTILVSVMAINNEIGVIQDLETISAICHEHGIIFHCDATQAAGKMDLNVDRLKVDLMSLSGHKVYGPMGIGVLYGREELLNAMPPFLTGGEMIESVTRDGAVFAELPHKFEAGTVNAADAVGLHAAIDYVKSIGFTAMHQQEVALTRRAMDAIGEMPHVHVLGSEKPEEHCGIITFTVDGVHPHDISEILTSGGVAIRAGHHCAQPLLAYLKHPSTARASLAFYNTESEVDRLLDSISTLRERMGYGK